MRLLGRKFLVLLFLFFSHNSEALELTFQGAYVPSIRFISASGQNDYYDGFGYGAKLSVSGGNFNEFYLSYLFTKQVSNYEDITPGPTYSNDQIIGIGMRRYLADGLRAFLQFEANSVFSNTFDSPKFGGSLGGGFSWMLSRSMSIGFTTLYGFIYYSEMHRRTLRQSVDLGIKF